jgi:tetrahydromethanopterin S-methyltransferase subunit C
VVVLEIICRRVGTVGNVLLVFTVQCGNFQFVRSATGVRSLNNGYQLFILASIVLFHQFNANISKCNNICISHILYLRIYE